MRHFTAGALFVVALLAIPYLSYAGHGPEFTTPTYGDLAAAQADSNKADEEDLYNYRKKWAIGLQAGLPGLGAEVAYNFHQHFNVRLRGTYFILSDYQINYEIDSRNVNVGLDADLMAFDLLFEYLPFKKSSFKIVAGGAYVNNFGASSTILLGENTQFGDIELSPEQVGTITISNKTAGFAPYAGFGFGRAVPKRRIGFGFEVGSYYLGAPDIELSATELLEPSANAEQEKAFEDAFDSFRWLPHLMFKISVRLD